MQRAVATLVDGVSLRLPQVEDLLIMKAVANRERDAEDVAALLATHPSVDLDRVRRWVGAFARAASMPDLLTDLEAQIARHSR